MKAAWPPATPPASHLRCVLGSAQENFQYAVDNENHPLADRHWFGWPWRFTIIFLSLVLAPGSQSPFFFLDRFYPPAIAKKKVVDAEARIKAEEDRKKAAAKAEAETAKAEAEAKAKAEAEAAKAAEEGYPQPEPNRAPSHAAVI